MVQRERRSADAAQSEARRPRVALYSHDTMGLGHMRRSLLIAQAVAGANRAASVMLIAGARQANAFTMPQGVDCLTLPAIQKDGHGQYRPRSLDVSIRELIEVRARTIKAAIEAFNPDVLIVDQMPRGALQELDLTLQTLQRQRSTRCVLGLRDILDDPEAVRREWAASASEEAIRRHYDAIWVYGDPAVYDPLEEYRFAPDIAFRTHFTGYLDPRARLALDSSDSPEPERPGALPPGRLMLCELGGGQDGARLAETFSEADLPAGTHGVIISGPFMPAEARARLRERAAVRPTLSVLEFVPEPLRLIDRADRVVAMGGYNTVCELLAFEKPALIVPRVAPRREQLIRAKRLQALGAIEVLHPAELTPRSLSEWLARRDLSAQHVRGRVDLNGLARLPRLLADLLPSQLAASWQRRETELSRVAS